jgi:hypothetical protein
MEEAEKEGRQAAAEGDAMTTHDTPEAGAMSIPERHSPVSVGATDPTHDTPEEIVGNCPECDAPIGDSVPGCVHWPTPHDTPEAAIAALNAGTHEPAVDDFGNQYLARVTEMRTVRYVGQIAIQEPVTHDTPEADRMSERIEAWRAIAAAQDVVIDRLRAALLRAALAIHGENCACGWEQAHDCAAAEARAILAEKP